MNAKQMALPELKNIFRGLQGKIAISWISCPYYCITCVSVPLCCCNKITGSRRSIKNINLFLTFLEIRKSKIRFTVWRGCCLLPRYYGGSFKTIKMELSYDTIQLDHFWIYAQKNKNQITLYSSLLQHFSQQPSYRISVGVYQSMNR
jgi:hypothetical protein